MEQYMGSRCGNCGKPVQRGAGKCPHCGVHLVGEKKVRYENRHESDATLKGMFLSTLIIGIIACFQYYGTVGIEGTIGMGFFALWPVLFIGSHLDDGTLAGWIFSTVICFIVFEIYFNLLVLPYVLHGVL